MVIFKEIYYCRNQIKTTPMNKASKIGDFNSVHYCWEQCVKARKLQCHRKKIEPKAHCS